jgi:hypothetical protein
MNGAVQIVFVGPHRWKAAAVFNPNAYPPGVRQIVDACGSRLALLLLHTLSMRHALEQDMTDFQDAVLRQRDEMATAVARRPDLTGVAVYDGLVHIAELHSCLNTLKSFLDVYARLIGQLINPTNDWSFGKANVDGFQLSGGRLVNRSHQRHFLVIDRSKSK